MIEAAGGVVWRLTRQHEHEVLVIHRPHQQDWSLPKGKRRRSESALACALREVHEETGLRCAAGHELPAVRYIDRKGRSRRVRYWAMRALSGEFRPNNEVDEVRWIQLEHACELLTHEHDFVVVSDLARVHADASWPATAVHSPSGPLRSLHEAATDRLVVGGGRSLESCDFR